MGVLWLQSLLFGVSGTQGWEDTSRGAGLAQAQGYWHAALQPGPRYRMTVLCWEGDTTGIIPRSFQRRWHRKVITPQLLYEIPHRFQRQFLEEGYLYASVRWKRFSCDEEGNCQGTLGISSGAPVRLDTIIIRGRWPAPRGAFYQITGLRPGEPLRVSQWEALARRLRSSPYATLVDTPRLWLFPGLAWIEVEVKPKAANRIDGALSLIGSGKPQVIGHLDLLLVSPLRLGEKMEVRYSQLPGGSQQLRLSGAVPYLVRGSMEVQMGFSLWRQDTSFLTREAQTQVKYRLTPSISLVVGYQGLASRLLNPQIYREWTWPPPPILDFRRRGIRLGWEYEALDWRAAPRRGWKASLLGTQGQRGYLRNPLLPRLAYERLPAKSPYQELTGSIERYIPLGTLLSLRTGVHGYRFLSEGGAFENELFRAGGAASLRAFAENTFPTAGYLHLVGEGRLHIEEADYLGVFIEGTRIDIFSRGEHTLYGMGLILQSRLSMGILRLTFAVGRLPNAPWDLRRALVRLEWVSEF
ncbi:MAG: hypothetical protein RMK19_00310 [Bacteroidia bacterium]|nr:outer membrane protein assembly factor [Bacteroidia bacterium]MDW8014439.1 hypothetical protein [Bacteroidia bacterium]